MLIHGVRSVQECFIYSQKNTCDARDVLRVSNVLLTVSPRKKHSGFRRRRLSYCLGSRSMLRHSNWKDLQNHNDLWWWSAKSHWRKNGTTHWKSVNKWTHNAFIFSDTRQHNLQKEEKKLMVLNTFASRHQFGTNNTCREKEAEKVDRISARWREKRERRITKRKEKEEQEMCMWITFQLHSQKFESLPEKWRRRRWNSFICRQSEFWFLCSKLSRSSHGFFFIGCFIFLFVFALWRCTIAHLCFWQINECFERWKTRRHSENNRRECHVCERHHNVQTCEELSTFRESEFFAKIGECCECFEKERANVTGYFVFHCAPKGCFFFLWLMCFFWFLIWPSGTFCSEYKPPKTQKKKKKRTKNEHQR